VAAKAKEKEQEQEAKTPNFDSKAAAEAFFKSLGLDPEKLVEALKEMIAEAVEASAADITDEQVMETVKALHKSGKLDAVLRNLGLVPKPGIFSAITGWHNVEHMRSRGFSNKLAGAMGIIYQGVALGLSIYLGVDWYRNRG
jgi:hypothetical protein